MFLTDFRIEISASSVKHCYFAISRSFSISFSLRNGLRPRLPKVSDLIYHQEEKKKKKNIHSVPCNNSIRACNSISNLSSQESHSHQTHR